LGACSRYNGSSSNNIYLYPVSITSGALTIGTALFSALSSSSYLPTGIALSSSSGDVFVSYSDGTSYGIEYATLSSGDSGNTLGTFNSVTISFSNGINITSLNYPRGIALDTSNNLYIPNILPYQGTGTNTNAYSFYIFYGAPTSGSVSLGGFYTTPAVYGAYSLTNISLGSGSSTKNYVYAGSSYPQILGNNEYSISLFDYNISQGNLTYNSTYFLQHINSPINILTYQLSGKNYLLVLNQYPNSSQEYFITVYTINSDGSLTFNNQFIDNTSNNQYLNNPISFTTGANDTHLFVLNYNNNNPFVSVFDISTVISSTNPPTNHIDVSSSDSYIYKIPAPYSEQIINISDIYYITNGVLQVSYSPPSETNLFNLVYSGSISAGTFAISLIPISNISIFGSSSNYFLGFSTFFNDYSVNITNINVPPSGPYDIYSNNTYTFNNYLVQNNFGEAYFLSSNNPSTNNPIYFELIASGTNNELVVFHNLYIPLNSNNVDLKAGSNSYNFTLTFPNDATNISISLVDPSQGIISSTTNNNVANVTYTTPNNSSSFDGIVNLNYSYSDSTAYSVSGQLSLKIYPVTQNNNYTTSINSPLIINLSDLTIGSDNIVTYTSPKNGVVYYSQLTNQFVYIPNSGFIGNDSFTYTLTTQDPLSSTSEINITVLTTPSLLSSAVRNKYNCVKS
jgi:hypothetical protein